MRPIIRQLADFLRYEDGRTAVECAILLAIFVLVCVSATGALGCASPAKK
jgi:Flp pilus assembly pilin Flp